jgi:hypothetical protein
MVIWYPTLNSTFWLYISKLLMLIDDDVHTEDD